METYDEQKYKREFQQRLLEHLIRKYENSTSFVKGEFGKQKPQISFVNGPFQLEYEDEMDFRKKEWIHEVVQSLAAQGIIQVKWEKFQEGQKLYKVYLMPEHLDRAYEQAGITPRAQKMERLQNILNPLTNHPWEWVALWARDSIQKLRERKSSGLDLDDPVGFKRLTEVLLELPKLEDDIPKRILSQRLFHDTKLFEREVERRLVSLIQNYSGIEYENDTEALESVGISDHSRGVWIAGKLCGSIDNNTISLDIFQGCIGLSKETVSKLTVDEINGERIVLIENLTSWHQWVTVRQGERELVVFTGGFPNRTTQLLLQKLGNYIYDNASKLPVYHWGDMDAGGIQIFEFIRDRYFPNLIPLGMDESSYLRYVDMGMEFSTDYAKKLENMLENKSLAHWHTLLNHMLTYKKRIEQECMMLPTEMLKREILAK